MNTLAKFASSSSQLMCFLNNWIETIDRKCEGSSDSPIKARYYIWARYTMSIRTLKHLCKTEFFPDMCVIARSCLEFSASLKAVLSDASAADDYVEFEKHAKSDYLRLVEGTAGNQKVAQLTESLNELSVDNPDDYRWNKWCSKQGGYAKLIEQHLGHDARRLYFFFSDFAHGSIGAVKILQNSLPSTDWLKRLIEAVYSDYLCSTKSFIDKVLGPIIPNDSQKCKNEFNEVIALFC